MLTHYFRKAGYDPGGASVDRIIGIDLGFMESSAAAIIDGRPQSITDRHGRSTFPSSVFLAPDGRAWAGDEAVKRGAEAPERLLEGLHRLMGCRYDSPEFQLWRQSARCGVGKARDGRALISFDGQYYRPEELCAASLVHLKFCAEQQLGEAVEEALLSVPIGFGFRQRQAVNLAASKARLRVQRSITHSTAAGLAWGFETNKSGRVLICDFGAGTLDLSLLELQEGICQVLAAGGDTCLGGMDIDSVLVRWLAADLDSEVPRLRKLAERVKIELSSMDRAEIKIPDRPGLHPVLIRSEFERMIDPLLQRAARLLEQVIHEADIEIASIDEILLLGGSSRIPRFVELIEKTLERKPRIPGSSRAWVAHGAAIQTGILEGEVTDLVLLDVLPRSLGIGLKDGGFIPFVPRCSSIPTKGSRYFQGRDFEKNEIHLMEGESVLAKDNELIRTYPIPSSLHPHSLLEVTLEVDVNGIIQLEIVDQSQRVVQPVDVQPDELVERPTNPEQLRGQLQGWWPPRRRPMSCSVANSATKNGKISRLR